MTDGQLFLLVFAAIYLSDCFAWTSPAMTGFVSWRNRLWRAVRPGALAGNDKGGLIFGAPFPPLGTCFLSGPWPLSVTATGISTLTVESPNPGRRLVQGERSIEWDEIKNIRRDRSTIYLNDVRFVKLPGAILADHWAKFISRLSQLPSDERDPEIREALRRSLKPRRVERKLRFFMKVTGCLRLCTNLLFWIWFAVIPLGYIKLGASLGFLLLLVEAFAVMLIASIIFLRLHRRFFPGLGSERWQHFFIVLFAPQFTMRSTDALAHHFFHDHHVLAVAGALLSEEGYSGFAAAYLRDLRNPIEFFEPEGQEEFAREIAQDFHSRYLLPEVEKVIHIAPEQSIGDGDQHCPRCLVDYSTPATHCEDCGGMELVANSVVQDQLPARGNPQSS